jgi:hypothetical protein
MSVRFWAPLLLAMLGAACNSPSFAPSGPSDSLGVPTNISGTWSGRYEVTTCTANVGDTRGCAHHRVGAVTLVVTQIGADVQGGLSLRSDQTGVLVVDSLHQSGKLFPVKGTYELGRLSLAGSERRQVQNESVEHVLQGWRTEASASGEMAGSMTWIAHQTVRTACCATFMRAYSISRLHRTD